MPPQPPPQDLRSRPPSFMHLYRLVFSKSRCLWPSLSDLFLGPFGLLVLLDPRHARGPLQPSQIQKIVGAGASPPTAPSPPSLRDGCAAARRTGWAAPNPNPTAISNPNPNPTAISTKTADFLSLCRCAPPDLRAVVGGLGVWELLQVKEVARLRWNCGKKVGWGELAGPSGQLQNPFPTAICFGRYSRCCQGGTTKLACTYARTKPVGSASPMD
jgi:hypothetical protein